MFLNLAYRVLEADRYTHAGKFKQNQTMALMGVGCPGKTVGMVGLGAMGEHMAPVFRALGLRSLYNKRSRLPEAREKELGVTWVDTMDDVFREADFLVVACALTNDTIELIKARHFDLMKPSAFFINTLSDDVANATSAQTVSFGANATQDCKTPALDVYETEPPER
jgi:glyoxylate reductase